MRGASPAGLLVLAVGVCGLARDAAACLDIGDPCHITDTWTALEPVHTAPIPTDGLVLVRVTGPSGAPPVVELITFDVSLGGMAVDGALEEVGVDGVLGWRPAQALVAGATYLVSGTIHNVNFTPGFEFCGEEFVPFAFEFTAAGGPMPPLVPPQVSLDESVVPVATLQLDELVCCDGAFPRREWSGCGSTQVVFDDGSCAPLHWTGSLRVTVSAAKSAPGDASMLAAELRLDGQLLDQQIVVDGGFELTHQRSMPFCTELSLRNLVTGEVTTSQQCHGSDLASQLGPQSLTPESPALDVCAGALYVCEIDELGEEWDPDRCTTWPDGDTGVPGGPTTGSGPGGDSTTGGESTTDATSPGAATSPADDGLVAHGCACASQDASWRDAWASLLVLVGVRRRRRR